MLRLISETSFGSKIGGAGGSILGEIKKIVSKITTRGWAAIWVDTQTAIAKASSLLYAKIKDLYDAIAEETKPFVQIDDVLSSAAKRVVKSGNLFVFENGDVSVDGKTVLKENTVDGSGIDLYGDDDYVFFSYLTSLKIYTIGTDGTLTLARTFTLTGENTIFANKISKANNNYCVPGRANLTRGFYYIPSADLLDEEVDLTFVEYSAGGNSGDVSKVIYFASNYVAFVLGVDGNGSGYMYNPTLPTIFSAGTRVGIHNAGHLARNAYVFGTQMLVMGDGRLFHVPAIDGTGLWGVDIGMTAQYIKLIGTLYYFLDTVNGIFATTDDIDVVPSISEITAYDIEVIATNKVMTLNSDNVRWSGLGKETHTKDFTIGESTITITYYELSDMTKLCMPDQQDNLDIIFAAEGKVDFFVMDIENETLKVIRDNTNGYVYIYVGGSYVEETTEVLS